MVSSFILSLFAVTACGGGGGGGDGATAPGDTGIIVSTFAGHSNIVEFDGIGITATFSGPWGITSDGTNFYIADSNNHKIRRINIATGAVTTLAGSGISGCVNGAGTAASFYYPGGLTTDGTNLYVSDAWNHKIRKIVIATGMVTTFAGADLSGNSDGIGTAAKFFYPSGITTDGANLYVADNGNDLVRKIVIATGEVTTLAGSTEGSSDGIGAAAKFKEPNGITIDGTNLYVSDTGNHKIRKIIIATGAVTTFAGSTTFGSSDGTGISAKFYFPYGIVSDGTNLYVADTSNHKIRKIVIAAGEVTSLAGSTTPASGSIDGTGSSARFNEPTELIQVGTDLYVVDKKNSEIRKIVISSGAVTTFAGSDTPYRTDAIGTAASFNLPSGITIDDGNLYVADTSNHKIRKIVIATGEVTTFAGSTSGDIDGTGTAARFDEPGGITTDGTNLFVADTLNDKIRKIVIATGVVSTLAGSSSYGDIDGIGAAASFFRPKGITTDGTNLYVADSANHKIRKIVIATGVVTTLAGSGLADQTDGTGTAARFYYPSGITLDGSNLYVADSDNHKIRKIVIATALVSTFAGTGFDGNVDGTGTAASFNSPFGIMSDGKNLYVADSTNHNIRIIALSSGVVSTLTGTGSAGYTDGTGASAKFNCPSGIISDGTFLYVADSENYVIRQIEF